MDSLFLDRAVPVLQNAQGITDEDRASLWDAFHGSPDEKSLATQLQSMPTVPDPVKHQLYDAKKASMPTADPVEKGIAIINRIGELNPKTLELVEKYPKLVSTLLGLIG
jgi:hypothetical protein